MENIDNCPVCGGLSKRRFGRSRGYQCKYGYYVECADNKCGITGRWAAQEHWAIKHWNKLKRE